MAVSDPNRSTIPSSSRVDTLLSRQTAEMLDRALAYCQEKMSYRGRDQAMAALRAESLLAHDYFRHSLTSQLAHYLIEMDVSVISIYSYSYGDLEEEGEDRGCRVTASLNLILQVRRRTAALASVIASLDQALLEQYRPLVAPHGEKMSAFLDVQMVDDRDVAEGIGFGAVLRSTFSRPIRVWPE